MNLTATEYTSTACFGAENWDLWHSGEFYFQYSFLKLTEEAKVSNATFRFLTFSKNGKPVGAAVLSSFLLQLDLLAGDTAVLRLVKKMFPGLLQVPVVCCGLPVSFGQHHFCVLDDTCFQELLTAVQKAIEKFAAETNCKLLAWKEFSSGFIGDLNLQNSGYLKLNSLPDTEVLLKEKNLEKFLQTARTQYRRKLKKTAEYLNGAGVNLNGLKIKVHPFMATHTNIFYKGYLSVMQRTATKLEIYEPSFFELLQKYYADDLKLLTIENASEEAISALLLQEKDTLNFLLVSKPKAQYNEALYSELVKAITLYGLRSGFKKIKMGQTSYYSKMAAGAQPLPLHIYLQSKNKAVQYILKNWGKALFPETQIPTVHFYKQDAATA